MMGISLYCRGLMEGATASCRKIFRGLQNSQEQDQHIEYAWLSFHPAALIQYSQRGWWKKKKKRSSWHWPRWWLGHLSFSIISESKNFPNYHLMYLATVNGGGAAHLHSWIIKSQSKHRTEFTDRMSCLRRLMQLASKQIWQGFMPTLGNDNDNGDNLARRYDTIIKYSQTQVPTVCIGVCWAYRSCRLLDTHHDTWCH